MLPEWELTELIRRYAGMSDMICATCTMAVVKIGEAYFHDTEIRTIAREVKPLEQFRAETQAGRPVETHSVQLGAAEMVNYQPRNPGGGRARKGRPL